MAASSLALVLRHLRQLVAVRGTDQLSDAVLLQRFAARHDADAFAALMQRHGPMVLHVCQRVLKHAHDAEDAFQATFLVLARKAAAIRQGTALGSWLHGVAYRLARKAQAAAARRALREQPPSELRLADPLVETIYRELQQVLDVELQGLPAKYRAPLVLCYLEGRTRDEAARQLGWSLGTVKKRLERGRELLRGRLIRRGVSPSSALLAAMLSQHTGSAAVPPLLLASTVQAAVSFAAGNAVAPGVVAAHVAALAEGVIQTMLMTKIKVGMALVLALGVVTTGAGVVAHHALASKQGDNPEPQVKVIDTPKAADKAQIRIDLYGDPLPLGATVRLGTVRLRHPGRWPALIFSADGKTLFSSNDANSVYLWDLATGQALRTLKISDQRWTQAAALSPDGKVLATGGYDGIRLLDPVTGQELRRLKAGHVASLAFTPDGQALISGGEDNEWAIRIWDSATGNERHRMLWQKGAVSFLACTRDGRTLISASNTVAEIHVADLATGRQLRTIHNPTRDYAGAIALAPNDKTVAVGGDVRRHGAGNVGGHTSLICLLDVATGQELQKFEGHQSSIQAIAFAPDGKTLASASYDATLRLWDVATGKELRRIEGIPRDMILLVFSPDGKTLAAHAGDGTIRLWEIATGKALHQGEGHEGYVNSVAFAPDGKTLVSTSFYENTPRLWDVATGKQLRRIRGHEEESYVRAAAFLPDGKAFVSGASDSTLRLWDTATGQELRQFPLHDPKRGEERQHVRSMGVSSDGKLLVAASGGFRGPPGETFHVLAWEIASGQQLVRRAVRDEPYRNFLGDFWPGFSPDGKTLAHQAGKDVQLRDLMTGKELRTLEAPDNLHSPYVYSPDSNLLAVRSYTPKHEGRSSWTADHKVRLYDVTTGKERLCVPTVGLERPIAFAPDGNTLATASDNTIHLWEIATGKERWRSPELDTWITSLAFSPDGKRLASGLRNTTVLIWDVTQVRMK
jgi:RNA polymerase sigma factor (sigma-70 family)